MMKNNGLLRRLTDRLHTVLLSHYVISLFVTVIIIILFFPASTKYKIEINKTQKFVTTLSCYADLTGDGISDLISIKDDTSNSFSVVIVEYPTQHTNQWNFEGKLIKYSNDYLIVGDYDNNYKEEIYLLSLSHDSLQLLCISDIKKNVPFLKSTFIAKVGSRNGKYDPTIQKADMDDLNNDGFKELIFAVNSGFSLTPRSIFAFDVHNKKCKSTPYLGLTVDKIIQKDITGDGKNEILIQGHGPDNITDTTVIYHDRSTWLMVLDQNLEFLFKPLEFKGAYSHLTPFVFEHKNKLNQAGFYLRVTASPSKSELYLFTKEGILTQKKDLQKISPAGINNPFTFQKNGSTFLILKKNNEDEILLVNENLEIEVEKGIEALAFPPAWFDIDKDGKDEMISIDRENNKMVIARNNLEHPVTINLNFGSEGLPVISVKENGRDMPEVVIWDHSALLFLSYQKNPVYYLQWFIYFGIYLSILLFTGLIRRIQRHQIERKRQIEKKMTELQLKIVKNQLDPHFTLNAVNSIIYAVGNNEPERATEHLYHFSNLYRHLLLTADQYKCSLKDELIFTTDYLKMEQLRYRDKYQFTIAVDENVSQDIEIPKMCIQTAVENAIKHGIAQLKSGGEITITANLIHTQLEIEIADNGIGRAAAKKNQLPSTHKGIELTQQYFDLFTKITKRKVTSEIIDLMDDTGTAAGTRVRIHVQLN
jgi:hypothetical protein